MKHLLHILLTIATLSIFSACHTTKEEEAAILQAGTWRGVITMQGMGLPFNFIVKKDSNNYKMSSR